MDIDKILQKFGVFSGLSGDALTACLPYCQDAMADRFLAVSSAMASWQ